MPQENETNTKYHLEENVLLLRILHNNLKKKVDDDECTSKKCLQNKKQFKNREIVSPDWKL